MVDDKKYEIVEGISGHWYYHFAFKGKSHRGLCNATTMHCNLPLSFWGTVGHLNEKYCSKCYELTQDAE